MEWISVKDRLPVTGSKALVYLKESWDGLPDVAWYEPGISDLSYWRCCEFMEKYVTHWMPLPEPPGD